MKDPKIFQKRSIWEDGFSLLWNRCIWIEKKSWWPIFENLWPFPPGGTVVLCFSETARRPKKRQLDWWGVWAQRPHPICTVTGGCNKVTLVVHGEKELPAPQDWEVEFPLGKDTPTRPACRRIQQTGDIRYRRSAFKVQKPATWHH
jgi:hypothetical protein